VLWLIRWQKYGKADHAVQEGPVPDAALQMYGLFTRIVLMQLGASSWRIHLQ